MNLFQRKRYKYFYDTHVHTSEASACAKNTGAEMARAAKAAGYTGIIITDHAWNGNTLSNVNIYNNIVHMWSASLS